MGAGKDIARVSRALGAGVVAARDSKELIEVECLIQFATKDSKMGSDPPSFVGPLW